MLVKEAPGNTAVTQPQCNNIALCRTSQELLLEPAQADLILA